MSIIQQALDAWNEHATVHGWQPVRLPTSDDRERKLGKLLRKYGEEGFYEVLAKAAASDFLCGRTERSEKHCHWRFKLDDLVRESFFVKIRDGNYDNRDAPTIQTKDPETLLWEARLRGYREKGMWIGIYGPKPGEPGCQVPKHLLAVH